MTVSLTTTRMLRAFEQRPPEPPGFFTGFFNARPENFYDSEEVAIDIERSDEDIAVPVLDITTGPNFNVSDKFDTKEFVPPVYKEAFRLNSFETLKRMPGQTPWTDPNYLAAATLKMRNGMSKVERKIYRAMELQASQILQTGKLSLTDSGSTVRYALDFKPKSTHFPVTSTTWATAGTNVESDLVSLADVIRKDGKGDPAVAIFGSTAWTRAINNTLFSKLFERRRADLGTIAPMQIAGNGGQYRGVIDIGNYQIDVWTYNGYYMSPTGTMTPYMTADKVIMMIPGVRLDASFGNIPRIVPPDSRVMPFIPPRVQRRGFGGVDLITNAWVDERGENLVGQIASRPLLIPTQIDGFGCLTTTQA